MCKCILYGCVVDNHASNCYCAEHGVVNRESVKIKYASSKETWVLEKCCLFLGCKVAIYDSGHIQKCKEYQTCLCLELRCQPNAHKKPCVCTQVCECEVYHCDLKSGCCDRKPNQKCRYFAVELCSHCQILRSRAMHFHLKKAKCNCKCKCDYECNGSCRQCETHEQQGWNLLDWQQHRNPKIFFETPRSAPYYFQDPKTGKQRKLCYECHKSCCVMKRFYRRCDFCFDTVCYECASKYEHSHTDVDCDGDGMLYWCFERGVCLDDKKHAQEPLY